MHENANTCIAPIAWYTTLMRAVKDAVRFYDPEGTQPEKIPVTKEMKA